MIERSNQAKMLVQNKNYTLMKNFLQKVGSKSTILDKKLDVTLLEPWSFLSDYPELTLSHSSQSFAFTTSQNQKAIAGWVGNKETPRSGQPLKGTESEWDAKWQGIQDSNL